MLGDGSRRAGDTLSCVPLQLEPLQLGNCSSSNRSSSHCI